MSSRLVGKIVIVVSYEQGVEMRLDGGVDRIERHGGGAFATGGISTRIIYRGQFLSYTRLRPEPVEVSVYICGPDYGILTMG